MVKQNVNIPKKPESVNIAMDNSVFGEWIQKWGMKTLVLLAGVHFVIAGMIMINHLWHPAIINGAEDMHAFAAYEAGSGQRLYGPMHVNYLEQWYTPLAFQIVGAVSSGFGFDIRSMRFVTCLFAIGAFVFIGLTIYRLTRHKWLAVIGSALFAGIDVGNWYCTPGPNAVHIFFVTLAAYLLIGDQDLRWGTVFSAILALFASFWAKQPGLAFLAAGVFYCWLKDYRKGLAATAFAGLLVGLCAGYFIAQPDSSFLSMIFMHRNHPLIWSSFFTPFLFPQMLGRYGVMIGLVLAGVLTLSRKKENWIRPEFVLLGAGAIVGCSSIKYGSGMASAMFLAAMLTVCGLNFLNKFMQNNKISMPLVFALMLVQITVLFMHEYSTLIITDDDDRRYKNLMEIVATPGKTVHYINQPFYNVLTGTKPYPRVGWDCWRKGVYDRSLYPEYLRKFYEKDPFDIIIIDYPLEDNSWFLYERINKNYVPVMEMPPAPNNTSTTTLRNKKVVFYRKDLAGQRGQQ
jgi:hypothetical protein